jgi:hypothetical protein
MLRKEPNLFDFCMEASTTHKKRKSSMSNNFHAGPNGPGKCTASVQACPFGGESGTENHFETMEAATAGFEKMNSDKNLTSVSKKAKSFPHKIKAEDPIDFKFSNKEIAKIVKDHPTAIVLEPGRYIMALTEEGWGANYTEQPESGYSDIELNDGVKIVDASDEVLGSYAKEHNLEVDQLRFMRDLQKTGYDYSKFPATKGFISGVEFNGYRNDLSAFDYDKIAKEYPGIIAEDGSLKWLSPGAPIIELKHKTPVIMPYATGGDEKLHAAWEEEYGNYEGYVETAMFTIGDPLSGKGSYVTEDKTPKDYS